MSTNIPFVDETWNPWQGCHKVSAGCTNCYMYREKYRYGQNPSIVTVSSMPTFMRPLKYAPGTWCFTCSWSDFFIEEADSVRKNAWSIIKTRYDVVFVIITKRVDRIKDCLPPDWYTGYSNVILGFTAEDQGWFDRRWTIMRSIPAVRYLCIHEPALGQILYAKDFLSLGNRAWVIAGGESGPDARPAHRIWFTLDRDQCAHWGTPFFFKSWGEWEWVKDKPNTTSKEFFAWPDKSFSIKTGSRNSGALLDCKLVQQKPIVNILNPQLEHL